jgi:hypothetical protein
MNPVLPRESEQLVSPELCEQLDVELATNADRVGEDQSRWNALALHVIQRKRPHATEDAA